MFNLFIGIYAVAGVLNVRDYFESEIQKIVNISKP